MKSKSHIVLYILCGIWNLTVCWPLVLLVRLFWGENLRWERNPDPDKGDGPSLWCDLKPDSWPTRSWYAKWDGGFFGWIKSWFRKGAEPHKLPEHLRGKHGRGTYRTWGGTTFGHGGIYGPGVVRDSKGWTQVQEHEHTHVEQFEAAVLRGFWVGAYTGIATGAAGKGWLGLGLFVFNWWAGYIWMIFNGITAVLRGEDFYLGSHHEEAAYALDDDWQDSVRAGEEAAKSDA